MQNKKYTVILRYSQMDNETYIERATVRGSTPDPVEAATVAVRRKCAKANGWTLAKTYERMDTIAVFEGHLTPA